ncbi:MAG: rhodanese-like domain-containing protein [Oligoflexia bacterium]|nr:rhodanese-like domain-containing protein [Oligoflexia bacterium]
MSLADLRALFFGEEPFTVIDVRSISEFCDGHIEGALRIPYEELLSFVSSLPKDSNFITVSNGGTGRSRSAADLLRSHGWFNARRLEGGYYQWSAAGLPSIESGLLAS